MLQNGYNTKGNPATVTIHTCPFDAIFHMLSICYVDCNDFNQVVNESTQSNAFCNFIKLANDPNSRDKVIYSRRNEMLQSFFDAKEFKKVITDHLIQYDCQTTFRNMLKLIGEENPVLNSIKKLTICEKCDTEQTEFIADMVFNIHQFDYTNIKSSLIPSIKKSKTICSGCYTPFIKKYEASDIIIFDIEDQNLGKIDYNQTYEQDFLSIPSIEISKVEKQLEYDNKQYELKGIIERLGGDESGGHFITHVRRSDGKWETYDDCYTIGPKKLNYTTAMAQAVGLCYVKKGKNVEIVFGCEFHNFLLKQVR